MPELTTYVEFDVICTCGNELKAEEGAMFRGQQRIEVEPCEECMHKEYERGCDETLEEV